MKCIKYSEDFERLWNSFDGAYGNKGSKKRTYSVYKSINVYADDLQMLLNAVGFQKAEKQQKMISGQFYENFQHVERWLRNERWTDEKGRRNNITDPADEALYAKYPHLRPQ